MNNYTPSLLKWIAKMFDHAYKKQWYETYWFFDLHGVISKPDYRKEGKEIIYYPYAKETLQFISEHRKDIIMILIIMQKITQVFCLIFSSSKNFIQ